MLFKWGLRPSPGCNYGHEKQSSTHITDEYSNRRFQGGMKELHNRCSAMAKLPGHTNLIKHKF